MNHQEIKAVVSLVGASVITKCFLIDRDGQKGTHRSDNVNPYATVEEWQAVKKETIIQKWNLEEMDYITLFLMLKKLI